MFFFFRASSRVFRIYLLHSELPALRNFHLADNNPFLLSAFFYSLLFSLTLESNPDVYISIDVYLSHVVYLIIVYLLCKTIFFSYNFRFRLS